MPSREEEIEERLEWEERKDDTPMFYHMIAGSCAGVSEHLCMFPVDTYKTHRQAANPLSSGVASPSFLDFVRRNGFFRLWRGSGAVMVGCVPSHAAYFSAYEAGKVRLGVDKPGHHPLAAAATGVCATLLHDAVSAPTDLVKQRLQLGYYRGVLHCVRSVAAAEGVASLWRSLPATLAMNVPYAATCVAVNESAKVVLRPLLGADAIVTYLASGALAGAAAAAVTTPLDVIKTRMQTNGLLGGGLHPVAPLCGLCESGGAGGPGGGGGAGAAAASASPSSGGAAGSATGAGLKLAQPECAAVVAARQQRTTTSASSSLFDTFRVAREQWKLEGVSGMFRGVRARVVVNAPSQAISWATYELVKRIILPQPPSNPNAIE